MKRTIITLYGFFVMTMVSLGQETRTEKFPMKGATLVNLDFEYPQLIKVETWDKKEIQVVANLHINNGKNNDDFKLESKIKGDVITISSYIEDIKKFNNVNIYVDDEDQENDVSITRNGKRITVGSNRRGVYISIELIVSIPKNVELNIDSQYGMVEVVNIPKSLKVKAKFGGADVAVSENTIKSLWASTSWGQIYSDLSKKIEIGGNDMPGKEMIARISNGGAKSIEIDSEFGNVFLRKAGR